MSVVDFAVTAIEVCVAGAGLAAVGSAINSIFVVKQQTVEIIETLGKYTRVATPGLNIKVPLLQSRAKTIDLRVQQYAFDVDAMTQDNSLVTTPVRLQYRIVDPPRYYYELSEPETQLAAHVSAAVTRVVGTIKFVDIPHAQENFALKVQGDLNPKLA